MASAAALLGLDFTVEFEGRVLTFAPVDNVEVVGLFEVHLEKVRWLALKRAAQHLSQEEYDRRADRLADDIAAGGCAYGSEFYQKALENRTGEHLKYLAYLMAAKRTADVDQALFDRFFKDAARAKEFTFKAAASMGLDEKKVEEAMAGGPKAANP